MNKLTIEVLDRVTGICPACKYPDIKLVLSSCNGNGKKFTGQSYILKCTHQDVCKLRKRAKKKHVSYEYSGYITLDHFECSNCGTEISCYDKFCNECGAKLED